jgi:hypothetical protein
MLAVPCTPQGTARAGTVTSPYQREDKLVPLATKDNAEGPILASPCMMRATPPASISRREASNVREPSVAGARKVATTTTHFPKRGDGNAPSVPMTVPVGM